jgi:galactose mutarotase-like enzyme
MGAVTLTTTTVDQFPALTLSNDLIACTVVPDLGAKLTSLRDLRSDREWLWTNTRIARRQVGIDESYVAKADSGGWDECFPSVSPCVYPLAPWEGSVIADHGELWSQRARVTTGSGKADTPTITTTIAGVALPYTFSRTLRLDAERATLRLDYDLRNESADDLAFIWSAHPLIPLEEGMSVRLPEGAQVNLNGGGRGGNVPGPGRYPWPLQSDGFDLTTLPSPNAGLSCKLWSEPLAEGWVELASRTGTLRFAFDPALVPQIGLWINAGGWAGDGGAPYSNLGLEPCLGAQDSLADAVTVENRYGILRAGATRHWWLEAQLTASDE